MRKIIYISLISAFLVMTSCSFGNRQAAEAQKPADTPPEIEQEQEIGQPSGHASKSVVPSKIGIITSEASSSEASYAAGILSEKYGDDLELYTAVYSEVNGDNSEALAGSAILLAEEDVEAIVFVNAPKGTAAAIDKLRSSYPYMLVICGSAKEEQELIASKADIVMNIDEDGMGPAIVEQARKMGAKTFVLYTFPRHMSDKTLSNRRDLFDETCSAHGIAFVDATAPDPEGETGVNGASDFIMEDVVRKVEQYGKETAFFSTSCELQDPLIKIVLQEGALYPQQCCPSPFHSYPEAFRIEAPNDKKGDAPYILERIEDAISDRGGNGRFSTWPYSFELFVAEAGIEYALRYLEGTIADRNDSGALSELCSEIAGGAYVKKFEATNGGVENYYLVLLDYVTF